LLHVSRCLMTEIADRIAPSVTSVEFPNTEIINSAVEQVVATDQHQSY